MQVDPAISDAAVKNILGKCWMTHDAMWFYSCLQEVGITKTNQLNLTAIKLLAGVETKRMLKAMGMLQVPFDSFDTVLRFFQGARAIVIPDWMKCSLDVVGDDTICWQWHSCFAHDGVQRLGVIDQYQCGVMYRIECWLEALGVKYVIDPVIEGCLMQTRNECRGEIRFIFD